MASKEQKAAWKAAGKKAAEHDRVVHAKERAEKRREDLLYVIGGSLLLVFGIGLTIWSYSSASGGGNYAVVYGPAIVGLGLLVKGITGLR